MSEGSLGDTDIAFYFTHWLTDLAGAEPTPLHGLEKFVLKFPQPVLLSFVNTMPLVQRLAHTTPTKLYLEYLRTTWGAYAALRGGLPSPAGPTAIAKMRLIVQAQADAEQREVHAAFDALPAADQKVLNEEMATSGVAGEPFELTPDVARGPAFLVYYSPAFVRLAAHDDSTVGTALRILAEVYRASRQLYPSSEDAAGRTVTVHIGALKGLCVEEILGVYTKGHAWLLEWRSDSEAIVSQRSLAEVVLGEPSATRAVPLRLWPARLAGVPAEAVEPYKFGLGNIAQAGGFGPAMPGEEPDVHGHGPAAAAE